MNAPLCRTLSTWAVVPAIILLGLISGQCQDWRQWRGPNRDARVPGFSVPDKWPDTLNPVWRRETGNGVATPALVGGRLLIMDENSIALLRFKQ